MGMLINFYVDLMEEKVLVETEGRRLTEACLALTLLYMLRKSIHEAPLDGTDVRDASHVIIPRLERDMKNAIRMLTPAERLYYEEAWLWMFYAGALYEQGRKSNRLVDMGDSQSPLWFTQMLAKHAHQSNVRAWTDAKKILEKFVYDNHLQP